MRRFLCRLFGHKAPLRQGMCRRCHEQLIPPNWVFDEIVDFFLRDYPRA